MADRPRRVIAWLVLKHGHGRDKFKLGHVNTLGRSNRCEVTLSDELVSGEHARIKFENTQFTLYDLVSTNGTYLNGKLISTSELLVDGDLIRLGNTELVFKRT
jgi:pSer/pThr/pTyr-binding forkhead associated (FHA) protein